MQINQIPDQMIQETIIEEVRKEKARRGLLNFVQYTFSDYITAKHNIFICSYLDKWIQGKIKRLMLFTPPRHGKTELVSRRMPAYILGRHPKSEIIVASYGQDLANLNSRRAKSIVEGQEYNNLFPQIGIGERGAVEEWETIIRSGKNKILTGGYKCTGIGGGITGRGFNYGIIDDPVKDRAEAESVTVRDGIWNWYTSTFYTRKAPGAGILLIMTRWHADDLAGRLITEMKQGGRDRWVIINLPAVIETQAIKEKDPLNRDIGEALWPKRFSEVELVDIKSTLGIYDWSALYMGKPVPVGGERIKRDWFDIIDRAPEDLKWVRFWDLAVSAADTANYTASFAMAKDRDGVFYLKDMINGQWEWPQTRKIILTTCKIEGTKVRVGIELGGQQKGFVDDLITDKRFSKYDIRGIRIDSDKLVRAQPWIARAEAGKVKLVRGKWNNEFLNIAIAFTGLEDKRDDEIDAVSGAYIMLSGGLQPRVRVVE